MKSLGKDPHIVVLSTLFPNSLQPMAGLFVRERMFRVAKHLPLMVVAPVPWFPFQFLIRMIRPSFRPAAPGTEIQESTTVFHPQFFSIPGAFKSLDGLFMAIGCLPRMWQLKRQGRLDIIDAHFTYPDGYAATLLGRWLNVPVTITMRGTEIRHVQDSAFRPRLITAMSRASRVFSVSDSLRQIALSCGIEASKLRVIGNGVDIGKFSPQSKIKARESLCISATAKVIVTVGGLVERKGFHRVIAAMPELIKKFPDLTYLVIGGPGPEGDMTKQLRQLVSDLKLDAAVKFLGPVASDQLSQPLSAANVFVLSTRNEGWANVLLEAMACGLPVIATDVGGNREVVASLALGTIVPFGDHAELVGAISKSLMANWDRDAIRAYAESNTWDNRVTALVQEFRALALKGTCTEML
jgi:teichuronic acid biosynthesis glycosyltransferase TuaC